MKELTSKQGFTLIELMIAITIAGILMVIGVPSLKYSILNNRVKTAASDFHISMLLARSEAIKRNSNIDITFTATGWDIKSGAELIRSYDDLSPDVSKLCNTDTDTTTSEACPVPLTINRNGRPLIPTFSLWFYTTKNNKVKERCVSLSLNGMPHVDMDSDDDPTNGC